MRTTTICNLIRPCATKIISMFFLPFFFALPSSRMNSDAQVEINMFLRATEMSQANINLGGFFDVNRTLFKSVSISHSLPIDNCSSTYHLSSLSSSFNCFYLKMKLLTTMVTYLVVLLQFQISIPSEEPAATTFITKNISYYES